MSEPENFVARWSRLKRQSEKGVPDRDVEPARQAEPAPPPADRAAAAPQSPTESRVPAFDPASLPPIEAIVEGTDIRAFLQSGVPAELTKAALRRAWSADPAIRDFIGLAENQWDFTDPTAIGGFGTLEATEDVRKLVAQAMGRIGEPAEPGEPGAIEPDPSPSSVRRTTAPPERGPSVSAVQEPGIRGESFHTPPAEAEGSDQQDTVDAASRDEERTAKHARHSSRRGHGSALPQ